MADGERLTNGASAVVGVLEAYGVTAVFGLPGVHNLELYRALAGSRLRHVAVRHEQGAGFMADGFARASGRPGVAVTISGPGLTNISTAIGQAWSDSTPILVLSSALERRHLGLEHGKVHEVIDQPALVRPFTTSSALALTGEQAAEMLHRAFCRFASERPRPAHVSLPQDVLARTASPSGKARRAPERPVPPPARIEAARRLLAGAARPVVILGGGASDAGAEALALAERLDAAVVTTIAAKGVVSDRQPLCLGTTLQRPAAQAFLARADVVVAVGTELAEPDLYITADAEAGAGAPTVQPDRLSLRAQVIRIDIDAAMTGRDSDPAVPLWGDAAATLAALADGLPPASRPAYRAEIAALKPRLRAPASPREAAHLKVLKALRRALPDNAVVAADMTQLAYAGCVLFEGLAPRSWLFPNGFGTLGYALPAAIGAKIACPDRAVAVLAGDCGLLFTVQELATAVEQGLPLAIVLWDNACLAEIRDGMAVRGITEIGVHPRNPDFVKLAESFGCATTEPRDADAFQAAVATALAGPGPTLIRLEEAQVMTWTA